MIGLLKSTSIVYLISVNDILGAAINSAAVNFRYLEAYIASGYCLLGYVRLRGKAVLCNGKTV